MAEKYDFSIDQGTTWNRELTFAQDGVPINFTGFTARMQFRRTRSQQAPDLDLTTENGGLTFIQLEGKITISITATQSALLSGSYFYDLETVSGSVVSRWLEGKSSINPEVTR